MKEQKLWKWFSILCVAVAVLLLPWPPSRFGGVFFGTLAVGSGGEYLMLKYRKKYKICNFLAILGRMLFILFLGSLIAVQGMIFSGMHADPEANDADAVLVLGARVYENGTPSATLTERMRVAVNFLNAHPAAIAVLCGGQGDNEPFAEAEAMRRYMTGHGIPEARLILEDTSTNTIQNIANAKTLLDQHFGGKYRTAVISSDFHLARGRRLLRHAGLDSYAIPAETPYFFQRVALHLREYGSIMGLILTGRW